MAGTNLFASQTSTLDICLTDENGLAVYAKCTGAPPTTANIFQHGCLIDRTDSGTGNPALYQNVGSSAVPYWALLASGGAVAATSLVDTNSNTAVSVGTTAAAVNYATVTNSATGIVSANAVQINANGTDAAVSLSMAPKGATGILTLGLSTGTGDIIVGSSSAAQSVLIANGAGAPTVSIANNGSAAATVNIAGGNAAAADVINIGTGLVGGAGSKTVNVATGASTVGVNTVNIGTGATTVAGGNVIHIGDGTPAGAGTNLITIGSVADVASTTTIQGGSGATAISLTPQTTGVVTIGASAGTGDVIVGSSSATQTVKIGNGAGVSTVNLANVSVAGANINMASAVTGAGITDTVTISGGNAAATGIKVVNILTGTPGTAGNNRLTMGGTVADSRVTVKADLVHLRSANYIATEGGANNAITGSLTDAGGTNVPLVAGLLVSVKLAHTLQAGANTFDFNGGGAVAIKSHYNTANDIGTAYAATGIIDLMYDGALWLDMSQ